MSILSHSSPEVILWSLNLSILRCLTCFFLSFFSTSSLSGWRRSKVYFTVLGVHHKSLVCVAPSIPTIFIEPHVLQNYFTRLWIQTSWWDCSDLTSLLKGRMGLIHSKESRSWVIRLLHHLYFIHECRKSFGFLCEGTWLCDIDIEMGQAWFCKKKKPTCPFYSL